MVVTARFIESTTLRELIAGTFEFPKDLAVSKLSKFGDSVWSWVDPLNERLDCYSPDRLTLDWQKLKINYKISDQIIADLKRYGFVRYAYSREVFGFRRGIRNAHPGTVVNEVTCIVRFVSRLCSETSVEGVSVIRELSDIVIEDLERVLTSSSLHPTNLRRLLSNLAAPGLGKLLEFGPVRWNCDDIKTLPWKWRERVPYERLPEPLFRFLSDVATADVRQFLEALCIPTEDGTKIIRRGNLFLKAFPQFCEVFAKYEEIRDEFRKAKTKEGWKKVYTRFNRKRGGRPGLKQFSQLVDRARGAAELIVTMYTGARHSELNSFTTESLVFDGGEWILRGTEIKRRSRWAPVLRDKWIAIPIVRDAVHLLEQTGRLVKSKHLFHHKTLRIINRRLGPQEHTNHLTDYLRVIDETGRWADVVIHSLRFRHSLVYELRKAGLGLPYISFQLKHYYDSLNRIPSGVTVAYGNLAGTASRKAVEDANRKFIEQIYHPKAIVTGGGSELHKARRAAYFEGMAVHGLNEEEVVDGLVRREFPLTDVGTAFCTGQRVIIIDGVKEDPPCIGGLRCNPPRCANAVIPEFKQPAWRRLATENRSRAADPAFSHARSYFEEAAAEAEAVIQFFQIERQEK